MAKINGENEKSINFKKKRSGLPQWAYLDYHTDKKNFDQNF
jgi:hypothetical protein